MVQITMLQPPANIIESQDVPAMEEDQGNCILDFRFPMDEVNVERSKMVNIDVCGELRYFVQVSLGLTPVVLLLPVLGEFLDICQWGTIFPLGPLDLVWKIAEFELFVQSVNLFLRHVNLVGLDGRHCDSLLEKVEDETSVFDVFVNSQF